MAISTKTLIKLGKWKMLLTSLKEGEHTFERLTSKQMESLRMTIYRTNYDRYDKEFIYECCYRGSILVVNKTRRNENDSISTR